jgi:hypothetical protein
MAHTDYFGALVLGNVLFINLDIYSFKSIMSLNADNDNTVDHMEVPFHLFGSQVYAGVSHCLDRAGGPVRIHQTCITVKTALPNMDI